MGRVFRNLRLGLRMLRSQPVLSAMSVAMIGLGIGLTTTVFSIIDATVIHPLPYPEADELVIVRGTRLRGSDNIPVRREDFLDWGERQTSFEGLGAFQMVNFNVGREEDIPDRRDGAYVTAGTFPVIGEPPLLGRTFTEEEAREGSDPVVVIGHGLWQTSLGGRPDVVGTTLIVDGEPHTIVGVMGPDFGFPNVEELWLPLRLEPRTGDRDVGGLTVVGRLADGTDMARAQADLDLISGQLAREYPESNTEVGARVMEFSTWVLDEEIHAFLATMLAAAFAVLVIACVNVANLLLVRAAGRTRDVAVRIAVGASRSALVVQLLTEALVLAALGAILGLGIGYVGVGWFERAVLAGTTAPFWLDLGIDGNIAAFVMVVAAGTGILAGILPALQASVTRVNDVLKDEARGASSLRMSRVSRWLVIGEIALSFGLLVAAGLTTRSVIAVGNFDSGMADDEVLVGQIVLRGDYGTPDRRRDFWTRLGASLAARPEIASAVLSSNVPGLGASGGAVEIEGQAYGGPEDYPVVQWLTVGTDFFSVVGVEAVAGRTFLEQDVYDETLPIVINSNFRRLYFPTGDPVGQRIRPRNPEGVPWRRVVGVVDGIPFGYIGDSDTLFNPGFYALNPPDAPLGSAWLLARTRNTPLEAVPRVREAVHSIDPALAVWNLSSLDDALAGEVWHIRVLGTLFIAFGLGALFMAASGLYAIMAFSVRRRRGEIGIRMTLGATAGEISRMFIREGLRQLVVGLALGLGLAVLLARSIRIALFDVDPTDPWMFVSVAVGMILVGLLASYFPARRAAALDPVDAIRYD